MPATLTVAVPDDVLARLRERAAAAGTTPEAVAAELLAAGFPPAPLLPAELPPPGPRPKLTPEEIAEGLARLAEATAFREELEAKYGIFPDSTPLIAADRRRDD